MNKKITLFFSLLFLGIVAMEAQQPNKSKKWAWLGFERPKSAGLVITPNKQSVFYCPMHKQPVGWEESDTFNPAATILNGEVVLLYRAEDNSATGIGQRTSRIGYASSSDGLHFRRHGAPVLYPDPSDGQAELECPGGCEDPRVAMTDDGTYVMFYTQWNRKQARLAVATSRDLVNWTKHGPAFAKAYNGRFKDDFSKSASVVTKMDKGRQVIAKINGKYWMYWGESFVNVATSEDLVNWTPMLNADGSLYMPIVPRKGYFDSQLTECGPPAIVTKDGILLVYNGKNQEGADGDSRYTANAYCAGQALFDAKNPARFIDRLDEPFFVPETDYERSGQYPAGTVFVEGLVPFNGAWYLYYGCADSKVSVAVRK